MAWVVPSGIWDLFLRWSDLVFGQERLTRWNFSLPHILWGLWKERNRRIFEDVGLQADRVAVQISTLLEENLATISEKGLLARGMKAGPPRTPRSLAHWNHPLEGWLVVNFDEASEVQRLGRGLGHES